MSYEMWKTIKERPKARKQIEEIIQQGKDLQDIFFESNDERHLPACKRKYTIAVSKQVFKMVMEDIESYKNPDPEVNDGSDDRHE